MATPALGIPSLARGGKLSQTSDRLYSCGFADWQSRPSSATGAGGFEVLIANCKIEVFSFMCFVSCSLAAMSTRVDFYSGAAWSAMPSVATRPISVVDVCSRHTLHGSW